MKETTLQQEIDEFQLKENSQYIKYIVNFFDLHLNKDNKTIKQLFKDKLHLIISDEGLDDIIELHKKFSYGN